jgi:hypothetical protein
MTSAFPPASSSPAPSANLAPHFPPPPRQVARTASSNVGIWLMRIFLLPFMAAALWLPVTAYERYWVLNHGEHVTARIVDKYEATNTKRITHYFLRCTYDVDAKTFTEDVPVDQQTFLSQTTGQTLEGRAGRFGSRGMFLADTNQPWKDVLTLALVSLGWDAFILFLVYVTWISPWRKLHIARNGQATLGTITDKKRSWQKTNKTRILKYQFTTPAGQTISGRVFTSGQRYDAASVGQPLTVLYLPQRPRANLAFEYSEFRLKDQLHG